MSSNSCCVMAKNFGQQNATEMVYNTPIITFDKAISRTTSPGSYRVDNTKYTTIIPFEINFAMDKYIKADEQVFILDTTELINCLTDLSFVHKGFDTQVTTIVNNDPNT